MGDMRKCQYCGDDYDQTEGVNERGDIGHTAGANMYCSLKCYMSDTTGRSFAGGTGKRLKWKKGKNDTQCEWCSEYFDRTNSAWDVWNNSIQWVFKEYSLGHCCSKICAKELCAYRNKKDGTDDETRAAQAQAAAKREAANQAKVKAGYAQINARNKSAEEQARAEAQRLEGENKEALKKYDDDAAAERKDCVVIDGIVYNASKTKLLGRADKMEEGDKKAPSGSIVIPEGVTEIVTRAFYGCKTISSITIPASVKTIGQEAFKNCTALESVTLSEGLEKIDTAAFEGCTALQTATIPSTVREMNGWKVPYTEVKYNEDYKTLDAAGHVSYATNFERKISLSYSAHGIFTKCSSLESVIIKARVKDLPNGMFLGCTNLKAVSLPDTLGSVAYGRLIYCPVTTVYFPASVDKELLLSAFDFDSLIDVNIVGGSLSGSVRKAFLKEQKGGREEVTLHENVPQEKADKAEFNSKYTKGTADDIRRARKKKEEKRVTLLTISVR